MSGTVNHNHNHNLSGRNLVVAIALNTFITLIEGIGGIISGSMALLSDAAHNLSDVVSLVISYFANQLSKRESTERETFGYRRSEILAAFINSATLIIIAIVIIVEAVQRLVDPRTIQASWIIGLALASILVNGLSVIVLKKDSARNINMRSAYIHLFTDLLTSFAVLIGGIAIKLFGWYRADALLSLVIAAYLLIVTWRIFRTSMRIIMQFTPERIDVHTIANEIENIPGIRNIHHIHVWQINEHELMFEAHVDMVDDICVSNFEDKLRQIRSVLASHGITHSTVQPEFSVKDSKRRIH